MLECSPWVECEATRIKQHYVRYFQLDTVKYQHAPKHYGKHYVLSVADDVADWMPQNIMKCFIAAGYLSVLGRSHPGAREGIRTPNLLIRSQMLYPLSYARLFICEPQ